MIGVDQGGRPVLFITRLWILSFAVLMFAPASSAKADALCVNLMGEPKGSQARLKRLRAVRCFT